MRVVSLLSSIFLLAITVAGGVLECSPPVAAHTQDHGRRLYASMCAVCHGDDREGYKADQAPSLAQREMLASVTPEHLTAAITNGRQGTTMSAWGVSHGGPLSPRDVGALVTYLRSYQDGPRAQLDERPLSGDANRGEQIYAAACVTCHESRGVGGRYEGIGNPQLLATASNGFLRYAIRHGRPGTAMPAFEGLGDQAIEDLVALLRTFQRAPMPLTVREEATQPPPLPLGPVPLNPKGPEPQHFKAGPGFTSADVVKAELDRHARMAILDARAPSDYTNGHIAGAVSVPFYDPEPYVDALPKDAWLVAYCGCPHAESGTLARKLAAKGFTKVTVIDEGLGYWTRKKYPTSTGALP